MFIIRAVFVNGKFCKDPKLVKVEDFFFSGINIPREPVKLYGTRVNLLTADRIPGLNTLGLSQARVDFAPGGVNPPHMHPRAAEILTVIEGTLYAGFVASNQNNNTLFTKVLYPGDVFVFPFGLVHFQFNIGESNAVAFATFSSQNPGVVTLGNAIFASKPSIMPDVIAKAFQLDKNIVQELQSKKWTFNT